MTLRPVDMQTMLPRLNEASRIQHNAEQQPFAVQHAQAAEAQAKAERARQQVLQKEAADHLSWQQDGGRKGGGPGEEKQQRGKAKKPAPESPADPARGRRLDVKL